MGISERKAFCSLLPDLCSWMRHPQRAVLFPALFGRRQMSNRPMLNGGKGKADSPLKAGLKAKHWESEYVPALSADAEVEGA